MFHHAENRALLWNALKKSPYLVELTQNSHFREGHKDVWFSGVCEQFYALWISKNGEVPTNSRELLEINKNALRFIVSDIKQLLGYSSAPLNPGVEVITLGDLPAYNVAAERQHREETRSREFNNYQAEYNRLLERPALPTNSLPSLSSDEKITNMEELIQQHMRMRDIDLSIYSKDTATTQSTMQSTLTSPQKLKIMDSIESVDMQIRELPRVDETHAHNPRVSNGIGEVIEKSKTVHWKEPELFTKDNYTNNELSGIM